MTQMSRRSFLLSTSAVAATGFLGMAIPGYASTQLAFGNDQPIPADIEYKDFNLKLKLVAEQNDEFMTVSWEIATDSEFNHIINNDSVTLKQDQEQVLNIVLNNVEQDMEVFYRLSFKNCDAYEIYELPFEQGVNINNLSLMRTDLG